MDDDDGALAFVTSVLAYCVENKGITAKQGDAVGRIIKRLKREFLAGVLACQCLPMRPMLHQRQARK